MSTSTIHEHLDYLPFQIVRQYILEFLSPISLPHGTHLLGAIAVAWNDRRNKNAAKNMKRVKDLVTAISVSYLQNC